MAITIRLKNQSIVLIINNLITQGVWMPTGDNVKIPVAIKVLQDDSNVGLNIELLDEARIMATVRHACCIRILAVCMTAEMMLVTQLMPLGSLLDYVRELGHNIGPATLLNWSKQIAQASRPILTIIVTKYMSLVSFVHSSV